MADRGLHDEDILIWSQRQAEALRTLTSRRDLPNELDLVNLIEEIEDVGRSEFNAAVSYVRLILTHAAKAWADPRSRALRHWAAEVGTWQDTLLQHVTPSMRSKIDVDRLWQRALRQAALDLAAQGRKDASQRIGQRPRTEPSPISLDDLCRDDGTFGDLVAKIPDIA